MGSYGEDFRRFQKLVIFVLKHIEYFWEDCFADRKYNAKSELMVICVTRFDKTIIISFKSK